MMCAFLVEACGFGVLDPGRQHGLCGECFDPGCVVDGERELGTECCGGAERSTQRPAQRLLDSADAGGRGEGVRLTGLEPGLGGRAVGTGGSCPAM